MSPLLRDVTGHAPLSHRNEPPHKPKPTDDAYDTELRCSKSQRRRRNGKQVRQLYRPLMTQCHLGLPVNSDQPSRYGDSYLDEDSIQSEEYTRAGIPRFIAQSGTRRPSGRDGEHKYHQLPDRRDISGSPGARSTRPPGLTCSPSKRDNSSFGSMVNQPSAVDLPIVPSFDFKETKRSPHKYVRQSATESGLSVLLNSGHSIPSKQAGLEDQSDCASARTKAFRQRSGRHAIERERRDVDYGTSQ